MKKNQYSDLIPVLIMILLWINGNCTKCPEKIKWKKLRSEEEVKSVLYKCLPVTTVKSVIIDFLSDHKIQYSETEINEIFFSVRIKSVSVWIEKKWAVRFILDDTGKLKNIKAEQWLTGP